MRAREKERERKRVETMGKGTGIMARRDPSRLQGETDVRLFLFARNAFGR